MTSAIGHPHIVEVIDFNFAPDGSPYIVMELLQGESLAQRLARSGSVDLCVAASIVRQAASALEAAHKKGVIHRDLKPQNIFLCRREETDDFVKILDLGVSKVLGSHSVVTHTPSLRAANRDYGDPAYHDSNIGFRCARAL